MLEALSFFKNSKRLQKLYKYHKEGQEDTDKAIIAALMSAKDTAFFSVSLNEEDLHKRLGEHPPSPGSNPTDFGLTLRAYPGLGFGNIDSSNFALRYYLEFLDA